MKRTAIIRKLDNGVILEYDGNEKYYEDHWKALTEFSEISPCDLFGFGNNKETLIELEFSEVVHAIQG